MLKALVLSSVLFMGASSSEEESSRHDLVYEASYSDRQQIDWLHRGARFAKLSHRGDAVKTQGESANWRPLIDSSWSPLNGSEIRHRTERAGVW